MFKTKEKAKGPEEGPGEAQTGSLSKKEFRVVMVEMIKEPGRRVAV